MSVDSIGQIYSYNNMPQYSCGSVNNNDRTHLQNHRQEFNDDNFENKNLGSAQTEIAKKGFKYFWKSCKNFFIKLFKGDKEAIEHVKDAYNIYDNSDKVVTLYDYFTSDSPEYDYQA